MPEFNDWGVSYSAISFVERALRGHAKVASFERTKDIEFDIGLTNGKSIKMVLVNEYTLGLAAIHRAQSEFPGVEYIVTCANWNGYTREAKDYGRENGLGCQSARNFDHLSALNFDQVSGGYCGA